MAITRAVVFDVDAVGDVAPKRIIRNAPAGTPTTGFTNASAAAYDSKRGEVLVPNCVSVPRISAFSRLANGNVAPDRIIEGQVTSLSRTMHGIAYDAVNDEIIVPVALSGAILVFRGDARGNEPPIRVIQGPDTGLIRPHTANVDPVSGEILAGDPSARGVLVFDRLANGNAKPKRVIAGPKTQFREIVGVASDARNNAIVVASRTPGGPSGLFVFNRLDQGDVAPKRIIAGPLTGALGRFRQVSIDPERGKIYLAVQAFRSQEPTPQKAADLYESETSLNKLRAAAGRGGLACARRHTAPPAGRFHWRVEYRRQRQRAAADDHPWTVDARGRLCRRGIQPGRGRGLRRQRRFERLPDVSRAAVLPDRVRRPARRYRRDTSPPVAGRTSSVKCDGGRPPSRGSGTSPPGRSGSRW